MFQTVSQNPSFSVFELQLVGARGTQEDPTAGA